MTGCSFISETHVFSPRLVNDFRFGLVHINNSAMNVNPVTVADAGIDRPTSNLTSSIYKFTFLTSGFQFGPTPQANQSQKQNNYNFVDNLSWVKGRAYAHGWRTVHRGSGSTSCSRRCSTGSCSSPILERRRISETSWAGRRSSASAAAAFTTTHTGRAIRRSSRRTTGR